jgi:hypothetical protein
MMSYVATRFRLIALAFLIAGVMPSFALDNNSGVSADGDSCDIDRDGLKIPGTKKGAKCCSVFDTKDCVDLPKPTPAQQSIKPKRGIKKNLNAPLLKQNP